MTTSQPSLFTRNVATMNPDDYELRELNLDEIEEEIAPENKNMTESLGEMEMVQFPVVTFNESTRKYKIISGKRRVLSARLNNVTKLLFIIKKGLSEKEFHFQSLAANTSQRNWADEADHVEKLVNMRESTKSIAKRTGLKITDVQQLRRIKKELIPEFLEALRAGDIVFSTVTELLKIRSKKVQQELYEQLKKDGKLTGETVYNRKKQQQQQVHFAGLDQATPSAVKEEKLAQIYLPINPDKKEQVVEFDGKKYQIILK